MLPDSLRTAQSRMKCRKVLGLGESADGHIPKSKVGRRTTQVLKHTENATTPNIIVSITFNLD